MGPFDDAGAVGAVAGGAGSTVAAPHVRPGVEEQALHLSSVALLDSSSTRLAPSPRLADSTSCFPARHIHTHTSIVIITTWPNAQGSPWKNTRTLEHVPNRAPRGPGLARRRLGCHHRRGRGNFRRPSKPGAAEVRVEDARQQRPRRGAPAATEALVTSATPVSRWAATAAASPSPTDRALQFFPPLFSPNYLLIVSFTEEHAAQLHEANGETSPYGVMDGRLSTEKSEGPAPGGEGVDGVHVCGYTDGDRQAAAGHHRYSPERRQCRHATAVCRQQTDRRARACHALPKPLHFSPSHIC
ncbi:unnamed protein product [Miscanthus lutarioriparius]|uniref:Uncharacterized protein n=1 Tax=Miscanthus lutarioriparius TaxID=422564 RepID=A0A811R0X1_9POAL|nr:unnamed protein product [Miscanthus lutarioriparius]